MHYELVLDTFLNSISVFYFDFLTLLYSLFYSPIIFYDKFVALSVNNSSLYALEYIKNSYPVAYLKYAVDSLFNNIGALTIYFFVNSSALGLFGIGYDNS